MKEIDTIKNIILKAGDLLLSGSNNPDIESNDIILEGLMDAYPVDGIVSEESLPINSDASRVWLVDPLDGSKEYNNGKDEYTITIALLDDTVPKLAMVYRPSTGDIYHSVGGKSYKNDDRIFVSDRSDLKNATLLVSSTEKGQSYLSEYIQGLGIRDVKDFGSTALKICMVAEGAADMYVSFTSKSRQIEEWDYLAAKIILENAGGTFSRIGSFIDRLEHMLIGQNGKLVI